MAAYQDLSNKTFGRLTVMRDTERKQGTNHLWLCRCECGAEVIVPTRSLNSRVTQSCGCMRREKSVTNLSGDLNEKIGRIDGTNASRIASKKPQVNNTSGVRGVSQNKKGLWVAYIGFKGKRYFLGSSKDKDVAISLRKEAEQKIYGEFLEWYKAQQKNEE